jgi:predicted RNA-binding protein associated with RNAse of E/G family
MRELTQQDKDEALAYAHKIVSAVEAEIQTDEWLRLYGGNSSERYLESRF